MHPFQLGIDVAKAKLDCALRTPEGKFRHKGIANTPAGFAALRDWLAKQAAVSIHVCMEATGTYWEAVAEFFAAAPDATVSVVNPAQIKAFGASQLVRTKTDRVDAKLIAQFCAERRPEAWIAPSPAEQALRAQLLRLDALLAMRTQEGNRLAVAREAVQAGIASHLQWLDGQIEQLAKAIMSTSTRTRACATSSACSIPSPAWGNAPSRSYWPTTAGSSASTPPARRWPLPGWTRASMNPAPASKAGHACPSSATPSCARRSTCPPW